MYLVCAILLFLSFRTSVLAASSSTIFACLVTYIHTVVFLLKNFNKNKGINYNMLYGVCVCVFLYQHQ